MDLADCSSAGPESKKLKTETAAQVLDPPHKKEAPVEEDTRSTEEIRAALFERLDELMKMEVGDDTLQAAITKANALDLKITQYEKDFAEVELINEAYGDKRDTVHGVKETSRDPIEYMRVRKQLARHFDSGLLQACSPLSSNGFAPTTFKKLFAPNSDPLHKQPKGVKPVRTMSEAAIEDHVDRIVQHELETGREIIRRECLAIGMSRDDMDRLLKAFDNKLEEYGPELMPKAD